MGGVLFSLYRYSYYLQDRDFYCYYCTRVLPPPLNHPHTESIVSLNHRFPSWSSLSMGVGSHTWKFEVNNVSKILLETKILLLQMKGEKNDSDVSKTKKQADNRKLDKAWQSGVVAGDVTRRPFVPLPNSPNSSQMLSFWSRVGCSKVSRQYRILVLPPSAGIPPSASTVWSMNSEDGCSLSRARTER